MNSQESSEVLPEVPKPSGKVTLSIEVVRLLSAFFAVFVVFSAVMTWGFLYYRGENRRSEESALAALQLEKARLISKVGSLEGTIERIEKFTEKLESKVGVESGKLRVGVGGSADEEEDLNDFLSRVHELPKLSSTMMTKEWKAGKFNDQFYDKLSFKLDELYEFAAALELRVNEVYEANEDSLSFWASNPSLWPVHGWLTSNFGYRLSPWGGSQVRMHKGIDIAAPYGAPVVAPSGGQVVYAGPKGGYGQAVIIDHGFGLQTLYGHNSQLFVSEGDKVTRGQRISAVGSTGSSTGPHLHYEVHVDGIPADPMNYILE